MISRAGAFTVAVVALAVSLTMVGLSSAGQEPATAASKLQWAMARSSLENVASADAGRAATDFDTPTTLIQNSSPLREDPAPAGWDAASTDRWGSFAQFAADVRAGLVPSYVKVVHYDNEAWAETPPEEQLHPGYYQRRFCGLAHSQGWRCYTGPAQDLCGVLAHPAGETYAECYLDLELAAKAARYADVIDIQAQALEVRGARVYGNFVRRAAAQARAANPDVTVLGNIAASPTGNRVSPRKMLACAHAALPYVSGFYTTVNSSDGEAMARFLELLDA